MIFALKRKTRKKAFSYYCVPYGFLVDDFVHLAHFLYVHFFSHSLCFCSSHSIIFFHESSRCSCLLHSYSLFNSSLAPFSSLISFFVCFLEFRMSSYGLLTIQKLYRLAFARSTYYILMVYQFHQDSVAFTISRTS